MAIAKDFVFFGRLSLDFAHTGDMGHGPSFERLKSPADLNRWLSISQLHLPKIRISSADLDDAQRARSAIWRIASALITNTVPKSNDVRCINCWARQPCLARQLSANARDMSWHSPSIEAALATIAQDAVRLFGDATQRARMRQCENPNCRAIFYDDSKPGLRRWCASNRCGDRMRARRYRERQATTLVDGSAGSTRIGSR